MEQQKREKATGAREPHVIDRHVGLRIRLRRRELGINQSALARLVNISFQQIQKYEMGVNRVSGSMLWEIAHALRTDVSYFYRGLDGEPQAAPAPATLLHPSFASNECIEIARAFSEIKSPKVRQEI